MKIPARIFLPVIAIRYSKKLGGKISEVATVIRKSSVEDFTARLRKFLLLLDKSRASGTRFEDLRLFQFFTGAPRAKQTVQFGGPAAERMTQRAEFQRVYVSRLIRAGSCP